MQMILVAPLAGAWIEIGRKQGNIRICRVAPLAGAWIEIYQIMKGMIALKLSLPLRERGLK